MPDAPAAVTYPLTGSADTKLSIWLFKDVKNSKSVPLIAVEALCSCKSDLHPKEFMSHGC